MRTFLSTCAILTWFLRAEEAAETPTAPGGSAPQRFAIAADGREHIRDEVKVTLREEFARELKLAAGPGRPLNPALLRNLHPAIQSIKGGHANGRGFLNGEEAPAHIRRRAGEVVPRLARMLTFVLHPKADPVAVADELRTSPYVESVSLSVVHRPGFIPSDPGFAQQWGHDIVGLTNALDVTPRHLISVAIVDTGVDLQHPDLDVAIIHERGGYGDFPTGDAPTDGRASYDHGTHVAGIVGAAINGQGVAGFGDQVQLIVLNCAAWTDDPDPADSEYRIRNATDAINDAITLQAQIINCSFGSDGASLTSAEVEVLDEAYAHNVLVVCAAGNGGSDLVGDDITGVYWDQHPAPFIVSNLQQDGTLQPSSNRGWGIDLAAPGTAIYSTIPITPPPPGGAPYGSKSGTSMAAPMVSGAAAVIMSMNAFLLDDHSVKHLLARMATDIGAEGKDDLFGWGRLTLSAPMLRILRSATAFVSPVDDTGGDNGDYDQPWGSLPAAFANVPDSAVLVLNGGDVDAAVYRYPAQTLTKPCTLTALPDRPVVIGE
jgi:hypothetical protein